jgi:hypothetical protein
MQGKLTGIGSAVTIKGLVEWDVAALAVARSVRRSIAQIKVDSARLWNR